jgi:chemotaxis signal transduction protein
MAETVPAKPSTSAPPATQAGMAVPSGAPKEQLLLSFRVGRDRYAVAASWIREVLAPGLRIAVPRAPSAVWGVATYHGRAYAVIDLRTFFNVTGKDAPGVSAQEQRILALEMPDRDIALLVDMVDAVGPKESIRGTNLEMTAARWADGLCAVRGNVVGLLAVDRLVADLDRLFE